MQTNCIRTKKENILIGELSQINNKLMITVKQSKKIETISVNEYIKLLLDASEKFENSN